jgi:hypothetical protein
LKSRLVVDPAVLPSISRLTDNPPLLSGTVNPSMFGRLLLDSADDHPLASGFLNRLRARHPEVPDALMVLLEDAQACLDVSLYRPAVVLLGLAYETAVEGVLLDLETKGSREASLELAEAWPWTSREVSL